MTYDKPQPGLNCSSLGYPPAVFPEELISPAKGLGSLVVSLTDEPQD
jgi:hypothetical protein